MTAENMQLLVHQKWTALLLAFQQRYEAITTIVCQVKGACDTIKLEGQI